jgi:hypothetical protein
MRKISAGDDGGGSTVCGLDMWFWTVEGGLLADL